MNAVANRLGALVLGLLALLAAPARAAGELDGEFVVQSATAAFSQGGLLLDAQVRYPMSMRVSDALKSGVTIAFELEVQIERPRRFWFDPVVLNLPIRRELAYHVISDRYVLQDDLGREQATFASLEMALEQIGSVNDLLIGTELQMRGPGPWNISVRAGIRRGRIADALRVLMFWSDDWHRQTDWYTWTLER